MFRPILLAVILLAAASDARAQNDPVTLEVSYTADLATALSGGLSDRVAFLDNADVTLLADLEQLIGWKHTSLFVYGLGNQGNSASELVGDVQGVDNIEAPVAWRIYEAFVEHRFADDRASVLMGLYDLNSEFDVEPVAGLFINSSFGIGAEYASSREFGPSIFPETSLGIRLRLLPHDTWYLQAVVLDGQPGDPDNPSAHPFEFGPNDGLLIGVETAKIFDRRSMTEETRRSRRVSRTASVPYRAKIGVGAWYYTADFDRIAGTREQGNAGAYLMGQYRLHAEPDDIDQGLRAFVRAGVADRRINRIAAFAGGGLVYTGLLSGREADEAGLGVAIAYHGAPWMRSAREAGAPVLRNESTVEATYRAAVFKWLSIQGDLQWVIHPDMDPTRDPALFGAVRFITSFWGTRRPLKNLSEKTDIPYQTLINLYLRDCAESEKRLSMKWKPAAKAS